VHLTVMVALSHLARYSVRHEILWKAADLRHVAYEGARTQVVHVVLALAVIAAEMRGSAQMSVESPEL